MTLAGGLLRPQWEPAVSQTIVASRPTAPYSCTLLPILMGPTAFPLRSFDES